MNNALCFINGIFGCHGNICCAILITSLGIPGFPPGMPNGFVRMFFSFFIFFYFSFFSFSFFFFFRRQGFRMITFDRQAGPLQNLNRSQVMVIGRSVSFSDPARPRVGVWGASNTPKSAPPPRKKIITKLCACVSEPQEHFWKKNLVGNLFFCVLRPQDDIFAKKKNSVTKN